MTFFVVILDSKYSKMTPKFVKQKSHWLHSSIKFANPNCTAPGCVLNVLAGLLPASRWWPDILPGQRNFSLVKSRFWLVKILGKKLTYPFVIFTLWTQLCFFKETKFKIYGRGFGCFFMNERVHAWPVNVAGDWSFWPGKLQCWPDIVLWPAVILSPAFNLRDVMWWLNKQSMLDLALYSNVLT